MPVLRVAPADYYEVLGVGDDATLKQIKTAFKKKAVKTHPDVNKSPNATKDFMLLKEAYEVLSNPDSRSKYDRRRRFGDWEASVSSGFADSARTRTRRSPLQEEDEDFYGLEDFFKDVEKELGSRARKRQGKPRSLWEELADLGEEFVDFLESSLEEERREARRSENQSRTSQRNGSGSSTGSDWGQRDARDSGKPPRAASAQKMKDIDDELAELKKKMGPR